MCWAVKNGVPYEKAENMEEHELVAHFIVFSQFENGNKTWDWTRMTFIERPS